MLRTFAKWPKKSIRHLPKRFFFNPPPQETDSLQKAVDFFSEIAKETGRNQKQKIIEEHLRENLHNKNYVIYLCIQTPCNKLTRRFYTIWKFSK